MKDPEPVDELTTRPPSTNCLILVLLAMMAVVVAMVIVATLASLRSGDDHPAVGRQLSDLALQPLTGTDQPVTWGDLTGKVVLVNFWGTWCGPCQWEIPHLAKLGEKFQDRHDFKLLPVSCGEVFPEDIDALRAKTQEFLSYLEIDLATYADPDGTTRRAFASVANLDVAPLTFLLDRRGVIRQVWEGFSPGAGIEQQMEASVIQLLAEDR